MQNYRDNHTRKKVNVICPDSMVTEDRYFMSMMFTQMFDKAGKKEF